jgi:peptidoglycan-N-acetylglucosamine deacetylase
MPLQVGYEARELGTRPVRWGPAINLKGRGIGLSVTRRVQDIAGMARLWPQDGDANQPAEPQVIITTSWDDGHQLDLRLAELLAEFDMPGTFYISPFDAEFRIADRLANSEIEDLAQHFEIGAHTLTHPRLPTVSRQAASDEIVNSKMYLEDITGSMVSSFCYPGGAYNAEHVQMVRDAGFSYARTVERFRRDARADPLRAPTTVHAYSHLVDIPQALHYGKLNPAATWGIYSHWERLAERLFDEVLAKGGVFHLWGHSWEVERNNDWAALRRILDYISRRPGVSYVVNGGLNYFREGAV